MSRRQRLASAQRDACATPRYRTALISQATHTPPWLGRSTGSYLLLVLALSGLLADGLADAGCLSQVGLPEAAAAFAAGPAPRVTPQGSDQQARAPGGQPGPYSPAHFSRDQLNQYPPPKKNPTHKFFYLFTVLPDFANFKVKKRRIQSHPSAFSVGCRLAAWKSLFFQIRNVRNVTFCCWQSPSPPPCRSAGAWTLSATWRALQPASWGTPQPLLTTQKSKTGASPKTMPPQPGDPPREGWSGWEHFPPLP